MLNRTKIAENLNSCKVNENLFVSYKKYIFHLNLSMHIRVETFVNIHEGNVSYKIEKKRFLRPLGFFLCMSNMAF
jgi:hypothetical protein